MRVSAALSVVLVVGVLVGMRVSARTTEQASPSLPGQGIPRCAIPKEFGRLVTFIRVMPRNFPVLPIYECAIGHVWQRP